MYKPLVIAWRFLRTDWRSGELRLLVAALLLSIIMVTALTAFVERLQIMLAGESSHFLAADRVLQSPRPVDHAFLLEAEKHALTQAKTLSFQSMLYAADEPHLVSVKAVSSSYPLVGKVKMRAQRFASTTAVATGPVQGEVWAESRLLQKMQLSVGDKVFIGETELLLSKVLVSEPDRGLGFLSLGARILMHLDDVKSTGIVSEGSRLRYAYLFKGDHDAIHVYEKWLLPKLSDSHKWLDLKNTQPTVAVSLARAKNFFLLSSCMVIVLVAIAVAMASNQYCQRHIKHIAVLKSLGASSLQIRNIFFSLMAIVFVGVLILGGLCAFILQEIILQQVATQLDTVLPDLTAWPFILGALSTIISLVSFTVPPILRLKAIPAVYIFQQSRQQDFPFSLLSLAIATAGLSLLLLLYTQQLLLSALLLASLLGLILVIALPAFFILKKLRRKGMHASHWWPMAVMNLQRRLQSNALQLALFSVSLMLLVVLLGLKNNLFVQWQQQLPAKTPNFFLINLQENNVPHVNAWLKKHHAQSSVIYPMIRGRLTEINGVKVRQYVSKERFKRSGADRELNLSWSEDIPADNTLVAGQWFNQNSKQALAGVSVESQLAKKLDIKLGDKLTFMIAAETLTAQVSSLRKVAWDRMRPNFYMLMDKTQLQSHPKTFMTSFYLPEHLHAQTAQLLKVIPTAIVIEIHSLIQQIRSVMHHVSLALQLVLVFVFTAVILVMSATVQGSLAGRRRENTVIRALGGSKQLIARSLLVEFVFLGFLSGILATIAAQCVLMLIQKYLFLMPVQLNPSLWGIAPVLGMTIVGLAGFISARTVVSVTPMQLLREQ